MVVVAAPKRPLEAEVVEAEEEEEAAEEESPLDGPLLFN